MPDVHIRPAEARDLPAVAALVSELADFEKLPGPDDAARARLGADFARGRFRLLVGERDGRVVAYALYFFQYSTFRAAPTLYLEDLYVQPAERGAGVGERLMQQLAAVAVAEGCARFDWTVLDWNVGAQKFYRALGAEVMSTWWTCRVEGEALPKLASHAATAERRR